MTSAVHETSAATSARDHLVQFVAPRTVLVALLLVDLLFVSLHLIGTTAHVWEDNRFNLEWDHGYAEWWQYTKEASACVILLLLARRTRGLVLVAWAAVLAYIVLDDSLRFHERSGELPESWIDSDYVLGIPVDDVGQLIFMATVGVVILPVLIYAHLRSTGTARRISRGLFFLGAAYVAYSVAADALSGVMRERTIATPWVLLEEASELFVMSIALAYLWGWLSSLRNRPHHP